jgi:Rrf2 family protein
VKVSARTQYACLAMLELGARHGSPQPVPIREIAQRHDVPPKFLVQILLQRKRAGLIASTRGAAGGYCLLKPPEDISFAEIIAAIDGNTEPHTAQDEQSAATSALKAIWRSVDQAQREILEATSLADILEDLGEQSEPMYHI